MRLSDRLTRMIDGMPDGASIILSVEDVKGWLSENGSGLDHDLTVRLDAYYFPGNEYRITHAALEEFQGQERNGGQ